MQGVLHLQFRFLYTNCVVQHQFSSLHGDLSLQSLREYLSEILSELLEVV